MEWFTITMKDGTTIYIDETQHNLLKRAISAKFSERPAFFFVDDENTIKIDYIATIRPDKDL